jgi:zinc transporter ZupT
VTTEAKQAHRAPGWILAAIPISLLAILALLLLAFDLPGLDRNGPPIEDVAVERTELRPGVIELRVRNDGPDAVRLAQVVVNDAFIAEASLPTEPIGRLGQATVRIPYLWNEGEAYEISLLTSTGVTVAHSIEAAAETPKADAGFFGLLGLLGLYVGLIPVMMGMLWLPFARRAREPVVRFLLAVTVGLLAFLAVEAVVEGIDQAGQGAQSFGGASLVFLGALLAYVAMTGVDGWLRRRRAGADGWRVALLVAIGIGLHNLGEGLAIGAAFSLGEAALGSFLVVGFTLHNITEGVGIAAPLLPTLRGEAAVSAAGGAAEGGQAGGASEGGPASGGSAHGSVAASGTAATPTLATFAGLTLLAGGPAILGAWVGGFAFSPLLANLFLGVGAGAIWQVIVEVGDLLRSYARSQGETVTTWVNVGGFALGVLIMYLTAFLVSF